MHAVTLVEHRCGFKEPHVARPEIMIVLSDSNEAWNEARTEDRLGRGPIIINFEDPMPGLKERRRRVGADQRVRYGLVESGWCIGCHRRRRSVQSRVRRGVE